MVTVDRTDQDYEDLVFAIKCVETGRARQIRKDAGISQYELADRVKVAQPTIFRWERGKSLPGLISGLDNAVAYGRELRKLSEATDN